MKAINEMAETLFLKETLKKVKDLYKSDIKSALAHESFDMSFRLYRPNEVNVNLEVLIQMPFGVGKSSDNPNLPGQMRQMVMFFRPIGFYTMTKGFLSSKFEVTVPKEFEIAVNLLKTKRKIPSNVKTSRLSLIENSVLAAFSMEAAIKAHEYKDCSFKANGMDCDIFMAFEGYPQVFMDDKYGVSGPIAAYLIKEQGSINPILEYTDLFNKFDNMELMTAFKRI